MTAANRMLHSCVSTLALLLAAHASAATDEFGSQVQQLTTFVLEVLPIGEIFDTTAATDAKWPLGERAAEAGPAEFACLRAEMVSANVRQYTLPKVREYAEADRNRLAADLQLLNTGAGKVFREYFLRLHEDTIANRVPRAMAEVMRGLPESQLRAAATLALDPKYAALRDLIGMGDMSKPGLTPAQETITRLMLQGMRKCNIATAIQADFEPPPIATELTFEARCANSIEIPKDAKLKPPHSSPDHPLEQPEYPPWSRRIGEEGETVIDVYVTEQGLVESARVRKSSGFPVLDTAAIYAAGAWQLVPGQVDGKVTCMWGTFATDFKLTN